MLNVLDLKLKYWLPLGLGVSEVMAFCSSSLRIFAT